MWDPRAAAGTAAGRTAIAGHLEVEVEGGGGQGQAMPFLIHW